nr:family 43 glycosylhydrolase [Paenibacillus bovis]
MTTFNNPVIKGLYADPDLVKFGDTYYIYPTTDGYEGWGGDEFSVFSAKQLTDEFKRENVIVDFKTDQVPWAVSNAWAPCTAKRGDKYFFYFCGKRPDGHSCIGVASSDSPTGPFTAEAEPLLTIELMREHNISIGQVIDPAIYEENGDYYMLFGNGGDGVIVKMNPDMISVDITTLRNYEGLYDFREAVEVFKRDGLYHFTWSCDDTGSENYHVNYGVSTSLFGPVEYKYTILSKNVEKNILATGHHSILALPEEDRYIIAFHRFSQEAMKTVTGNARGRNREVCLAELSFNKEGLLEPVSFESIMTEIK